jgi:hypothetical protein
MLAPRRAAAPPPRPATPRIPVYAALVLVCLLLLAATARRLATAAALPLAAAPLPAPVPAPPPAPPPAPAADTADYAAAAAATAPAYALLRGSGVQRHGDSFFLEVAGAAAPAPPAAAPAALPRILILTPVKDALRHLDRYFGLLRNLSYPPHLLSLGMMDSDSGDAPPAALASALYSPASLGALGVGAEALAAARPSGTLARQLLEAPALAAAGWRRVVVARHNFGYSLPRATRHDKGAQQRRREVLARSRNHLLSLALRDEDWVLWLDSDLRHYPADLLQRLVGAAAGGAQGGEGGEGGAPARARPRRQILVPNCVLQLGGGRSYDLNSWRGGAPLSPGSNASVEAVRAYHNKHSPSEQGGSSALEVEGYGSTGAHYLHHFRLRASSSGSSSSSSAGAAASATPARAGTVWVEEEEAQGADTVVRLDAVGGAALLVDAELHRHGLVFPPFPYRKRIETEGLSMMAMDMGALSWGMPFLEVLHN